MKGIKKWSLKYPLGAAGILLAAAGALILYWAFGREQASELVVGLIGAGLSWLAAGLLFVCSGRSAHPWRIVLRM